jgi:hypothetical protein
MAPVFTTLVAEYINVVYFLCMIFNVLYLYFIL